MAIDIQGACIEKMAAKCPTDTKVLYVVPANTIAQLFTGRLFNDDLLRG